MLTRVLFALVISAGLAAGAAAEDATIRGLGLTDHVVSAAELEKGDPLPPPRFNTPGVAYVWASGLKQGDSIDVTLSKDGKPLMHNTETLAEDKTDTVLMAGKTGVPAGGWPEGSYRAEAKITRDGKTLLEQKSEPMAFE